MRLWFFVKASIASLSALLVLAAVAAAAAPADLPSEVGQGRALAEALQSGQRGCSDLSEADFELVGEYAMNLYLGDVSAHAAMNERMTRMIGGRGEAAMHAALGRRFAGCTGGADDAWAMPMAGMMGGAGGYGAGYGPGHADRAGSYGREMMGSGIADRGADDGMTGMTAAAIAVGAALLGGILVAAGFAFGRRSAPGRE